MLFCFTMSVSFSYYVWEENERKNSSSLTTTTQIWHTSTQRSCKEVFHNVFVLSWWKMQFQCQEWKRTNTSPICSCNLKSYGFLNYTFSRGSKATNNAYYKHNCVQRISSLPVFRNLHPSLFKPPPFFNPSFQLLLKKLQPLFKKGGRTVVTFMTI